MRRCEQLTAADWLAIDETPWGQLATFGPPSFEAYARLRYMPDPQWVGQRARENMQPLPHVTELDQVRRALRHLADYTATPDECFFCEWDGYGGDWLGDTVAGPRRVREDPVA